MRACRPLLAATAGGSGGRATACVTVAEGAWGEACEHDSVAAGGGSANRSAGNSPSKKAASLGSVSRSSSRRRKRSRMPKVCSKARVAWVSDSESSPWSTKVALRSVASGGRPATSARMRTISCSMRGSRFMVVVAVRLETVGSEAIGAGTAVRRLNQCTSRRNG